MTRLSVVDEIFLRTHRGYGIPVAMQGIWVFDEPIDRAALERADHMLGHGALGVRIVRPRIPGARRRWVRATDPAGVRWSDPITDVAAWADHCADVPLDPEFGPGWRLAAAPYGTGAAVSVVCSHVVADARGLIAAATAAVSDATPEPSPLLHEGRSDETRSDDLRDAATVLGRVIGRTAAASASLAVDPTRRADLRRYLTASRTAPSAPRARPANWSPVSVVADLPAADFESRAHADGGTPNVLFLSIVAGVVDLLRCGGGAAVTLGVPMRVEAGGANALSVTAVHAAPDTPLTDVRAAARTAYRHPLTAPAGFPDELLHVVPDRWAAALAPSTGRRDALCSNIGDLPDAVRHIGGVTARRVATRAIHPGLRWEQAAASPTVLSAYVSRCAGTYTVSVVVTDPTAAHTVDTVRRAVAAAAARHALSPRFW
ncbi:hypothetical protein [Rhodococcoides corynebacterioides]|uniref:hypothetical protein n=1 Tax=Rhodococcoides corynebacterioides TaxID=53972 RepID=UPI00082F5A87|nr:hypothetical protein [Rhodococcus corynebacterioides]